LFGYWIGLIWPIQTHILWEMVRGTHFGLGQELKIFVSHTYMFWASQLIRARIRIRKLDAWQACLHRIFLRHQSASFIREWSSMCPFTCVYCSCSSFISSGSVGNINVLVLSSHHKQQWYSTIPIHVCMIFSWRFFFPTKDKAPNFIFLTLLIP